MSTTPSHQDFPSLLNDALCSDPGQLLAAFDALDATHPIGDTEQVRSMAMKGEHGIALLAWLVRKGRVKPESFQEWASFLAASLAWSQDMSLVEQFGKEAMTGLLARGGSMSDKRRMDLIEAACAHGMGCVALALWEHGAALPGEKMTELLGSSLDTLRRHSRLTAKASTREWLCTLVGAMPPKELAAFMDGNGGWVIAEQDALFDRKGELRGAVQAVARTAIRRTEMEQTVEAVAGADGGSRSRPRL